METGSIHVQNLNDAERNYKIYDKEMLAMMKGFYEWAHYLKGNDATTEVLTDHQNLTYIFQTTPKPKLMTSTMGIRFTGI